MSSSLVRTCNSNRNGLLQHTPWLIITSSTYQLALRLTDLVVLFHTSKHEISEKQNDKDDPFDSSESGYARGDVSLTSVHTYMYVKRPSKICLGYTECLEKLVCCLFWTNAPTIKQLPVTLIVGTMSARILSTS